MKVLDAPGHDPLRASLTHGLGEDGVFEIAKRGIERFLEHRPSDGGDLEEPEKLPYFRSRLRRSQNTNGEVVNRGHRRGAKETGKAPELHSSEKLSGFRRVRLSVEKKVENDVGVEQDLQRCFS